MTVFTSAGEMIQTALFHASVKWARASPSPMKRVALTMAHTSQRVHALEECRSRLCHAVFHSKVAFHSPVSTVPWWAIRNVCPTDSRSDAVRPGVLVSF
jgi:hypothetical protein